MAEEECKTQIFKTPAQWQSGLLIDLSISDKGRITLANGAGKGTYYSKVLDSGIPACQWHRLELKANIPVNTLLEVYYCSFDNVKIKQKVENLYSDPERSPRQKAEIIERIASEKNLPWIGAEKNPEDILFREKTGRCICLKLVLSSLNTDAKPAVTDMKLYYPRDAYMYMHYLPAVYQEDKDSSEFLHRFLSIFQTIGEGLEGKIENVPTLLDAKKTPGEFLSWLSSWVGTIYDETWQEERWREFLSRAVELFKKKGTRIGLEEVLKIYSGHKPYIMEQFPVNRACKNKKVVKLTDALGTGYLFGKQAYKKESQSPGTDKEYEPCFLVFLKPEALQGNLLTTIKRIIREWKPAHTCFSLTVLAPWFCLDKHTYLGINTVLKEPEFILDVSSLILDKTVISPGKKSGLNIKKQQEV